MWQQYKEENFIWWKWKYDLKEGFKDGEGELYIKQREYNLNLTLSNVKCI